MALLLDRITRLNTDEAFSMDTHSIYEDTIAAHNTCWDFKALRKRRKSTRDSILSGMGGVLEN